MALSWGVMLANTALVPVPCFARVRVPLGLNAAS